MNHILITYVVRKDDKLVEYAQAILCRKENPFVDMVRPTPIMNPDSLINQNTTIRVYSDYYEGTDGNVYYQVKEISFK